MSCEPPDLRLSTVGAVVPTKDPRSNEEQESVRVY
jgi:hypothetical protein